MPTIQNRRATAAQWNAVNPVLAAGEIGFELDSNAIKIGDGLTPWKTLRYLSDESLKALVESGRLSEAVLNATYVTPIGVDARVQETFLARVPMEMHGFSVTQTDRGHWFRGFAPDGSMIALMTRSVGGRTLGRSTDDGETWTLLGIPSTSDSVNYMWFFGSTWFAHASGALHRSTDGGMTWAQVCAIGGILGQGVARQADGTMWAVEYVGDARVFRSTDDGVTWTIAKNFPNTDSGDGNVVRHLHGVMVDSDQGVWVFSGDNNTQCGLWKWDGSDFIRQSPAVTDAEGAQRWRTVGLAERDGWFYWVQDGAAATGEIPAIVKANPANLAGTLTVLAELPTGGWYIEKTPDGDLVVGSVNEGIGKEADRANRLWLVDADDRVTEVWSSAQAPTLSTTFPAVRNLAVRPTDGLVAFTINQTDWTGTNGWGTVAGYVKVGQRPLSMSRETVPSAYPDTARVWQTEGTTISPTQTGGGVYQLIPEMEIEVAARNTRPLIVSLSMDCRNNTAATYTHVRLAAIDKFGTGGTFSLGVARCAGTNYTQVALTTLFVPPAGGDFIIQAQWSTPDGSISESGDGKRRRLVVWEP